MTIRWPDLAALELLVAIAKEGSLSGAARSVGMAQPNATRTMIRLERELGVALLDRRTTGSQLTDAGTVLLDGAADIVAGAKTLLQQARELGEEGRSHLRVGASLTVAEYLIPGWLAALRRDRPDLQVRMVVENSRQIFEEITRGGVDVGFVESPNIPAGLRRLVVSADRLAVVVAPEHPWARRQEPLTGTELAAAALVVREYGSGTRISLERALKGHTMLTPAMELSSNAAIRLAVAAGAGPAVLSDCAIRAQVATGELVEVGVVGVSLARRIRAVWKGSRVLAGPAGELVAAALADYRSGW